MDLQCVTEYSRVTGRLSALPDPRVLVEALRRTFIHRHAKKSQILSRSRELTRDHHHVT